MRNFGANSNLKPAARLRKFDDSPMTGWPTSFGPTNALSLRSNIVV